MSRNSEGLEVKHKFSRHLQSSDQEVRFQGLLGETNHGIQPETGGNDANDANTVFETCPSWRRICNHKMYL